MRGTTKNMEGAKKGLPKGGNCEKVKTYLRTPL